MKAKRLVVLAGAIIMAGTILEAKFNVGLRAQLKRTDGVVNAEIPFPLVEWWRFVGGTDAGEATFIFAKRFQQLNINIDFSEGLQIDANDNPIEATRPRLFFIKNHNPTRQIALTGSIIRYNAGAILDGDVQIYIGPNGLWGYVDPTDTLPEIDVITLLVGDPLGGPIDVTVWFMGV